ncbi:MAG TPA: chromosomal replication initiator protein DnaA [Anaerohalosphaeraceae bacterium]|nr:chromosomal replication initiator protein DnaA [Phycisphaerae bacterium]HOK95599.1 chromosomal replication initiator protein DnaA [Anaerohalosphaeraceae bacterium]HOL30924.1 chromosomal replication initiator protein DnaA [Anaerohalosphaeraceae bacterium]HOM76277.1 chromosomal replication initiator protein DnaA [Anaerohalosphaeraceae bacterium]HPC65133.1 chromosomal replication initiator protein DnaA [Anaerohalosphaeraceae bacterium]
MQAVITDEMQALHERIAAKIGTTQFQVWFKQAARLTLHSDHLEVAAANPFICNWIQGHFAAAVSEALAEVIGQSRPLRFLIDNKLVKSSPRPILEQQKAERTLNSLKRVPAVPKTAAGQLPLKLTMDTFVVGAKNQLAYNAAQSVIQEEKSPFNPLFLHGGYGVGKTHLLQGVCNAIHVQRPGCRWMYLSAEDFANQYVVALKTRRLDEFRSRFRKLDLLAIDDIHFLSNKNAMQEEFLHTFNSIDLAGKQIILASDAHPREIGQLCQKLVSRFISGMVVRMEAPDFEMRCRICSRRAQCMKLTLSQEVIEYIAGSITTNVRELEGALLKMAAFESLSGQPITLSAARQILAEHVVRMDPVVQNSEILSAAADLFGVSVSDMYSAKKDRTTTLARSAAMYLTRRFTKMSFPEIGRAFGNKNHATVILACRKIDQALAAGKTFKWQTKGGWQSMAAKEVLDALIEKIS